MILTQAILFFLHHSWAFTPQIQSSSLPRIRHKVFIHSRINDENNEDWRAFRARLVQNGIPTSIESIVENKESDDILMNSRRYAYTTPLVEVGSILLSIPTTDLCQAIDQQYWHRSVVIITQISDNVKLGIAEDEVPDDQLADGANRGRWSYRGLLLNRGLDLELVEDYKHGKLTTTHLTEKSGAWRIQRGGDLLGLNSSSSDTQFVCLHNLGISDQKLASVSTTLIENLCRITIEDAKQLCTEYPEKYKSTDFFTFAGFCAWRPGQLEREMGDEREEWLVLSVDGQSIWDGLHAQRRDLLDLQQRANNHISVGGEMLDICTSMWQNYLSMVNMSGSEATKRLPSGQLNFYDQMLKVWAEEHMSTKHLLSPPPLLRNSAQEIGPGTLIRAKFPPTNDMLLYDAEFIRSFILVLEDTPDCTVGVILNHPMPASIEYDEGQDIIIRYGGPTDVASWREGSYQDYTENDLDSTSIMNDETDEYMFVDDESNALYGDTYFDDSDDGDADSSTFIWVHRDSELKGTQLGASGLSLVKEDDVIAALQSGSIHAEDVMAFASVCIWGKGGLAEQIGPLGSFEVVQGHTQTNKCINSVWDILSGQQQILRSQSLDMNIDSTINAWNSCSNKKELISDSTLADAALKAWIAINLLEKPLETLVAT